LSPERKELSGEGIPATKERDRSSHRAYTQGKTLGGGEREKERGPVFKGLGILVGLLGGDIFQESPAFKGGTRHLSFGKGGVYVIGFEECILTEKKTLRTKKTIRRGRHSVSS